MMDPVTIGSVVGAFVAALLVGLGYGIKRGRQKAIEDGEPAMFSQAWRERADRNFQKMHDDAGTLAAHGIRISLVEGWSKKLEGELASRGESLERELHELSETVSGLRADIAGLRGEMGYERRDGKRP
jgi:hypothetical protein